jgi:hypothetical protein
VKHITILLSHGLVFLFAMLFSKWLMGRADQSRNGMIQHSASAEIHAPVETLLITRLLTNYIEGSWWQTKVQFLKFFDSAPLYKQDDKQFPQDAPFLDTVNCDNYTVLISNEDWNPLARYPSQSLVSKISPKQAATSLEDTSSPLFRCYLTAGFSKKTEMNQWWYLWFSK